MVVICKAIDVIKDKKGNTSGYVLADTTGKTMSVPSDKIKEAILYKQVIVSNLKVTSNYRLINEDIDIPERFNTLADEISKLSGVSHNKPYIDNFYFCTKFGEKSVHLKCTLDEKDVIIDFKDAQGNYVKYNLGTLSVSGAAGLINNLYKASAINKNTANKETIKPKSEDNKPQIRTIVLNSSQILRDGEEVAKKNGLAWNEHYRYFTVVDENLNIVLNLDIDLYMNIKFKDSRVNGIKIISSTLENDNRVVLEMCEMQYLDTTNTCPRLDGCIVYNTAIINRGTFSLIGLNYINIAKINNCSEVRLANIVANNVYIYSTKVRINAEYGAQYIHNLDIRAEESVLISGSTWTAENIKIATKLLRVSINQFNTDTDRDIQIELANLNKICAFTYPNLYMIVCNHFINANEVEALVDISKCTSVSILELAWRCKFTPEIKFDAAEEFSKIYNAEIVQDSIPDNIKFNEGGIAITNNTNIIFNNIKIANLGSHIYKRSRTKNYMLGTSGIFLLDNSVKNFNITITNSIKPATKTYIYDFNLELKELKKISKIKPINVYYGTQAYEILSTNGVELNILNKDEISQKIVNTSIKEGIIGVTVMDTVENSVREALKNTSDSERYPINTGIDIELPDKIIETYNLSVTDSRSSAINTATKSILDMLMLFPANNLPFTTEVLDKVASDTKFRTNTELIFSYENIRINLISIVYTDIMDIDQYVVVTNGKSLIYMTYVGNCEIKCNKGSSIDIQDGVQAIRKFSAVDLVLKSITQEVTISSVKNTKDFINDISILFNNTTAFILNSKTSSILTVGASGKIVSFKVGYSKYKNSKFDTIYERQYINKIEKLESNDVITNIQNDVKESYKKSVLLRTKDIATNSSNEDNSISVCKVSSLWQLANKYEEQGFDTITIDMLNDLLELPYFNLLTESEFNRALKKVSGTRKNYRTDGTFEIKAFLFHGKLKKLQNDYMCKIDYLYQITFGDGSVEYYSADEEIDVVIGYLKRVTQRRIDRTFESFIDDYNIIKEAYGEPHIAADLMASNIDDNSRNLLYMSVPGEKIYYAIKDAEDKGEYDKKLHILNLIGMTEYEYIDLIGMGRQVSDADKYKNINSTVIAKMPKSQELLDILQMKEEDFDSLVNMLKLTKLINDNTNNMLSSLVKLYASKRKLSCTYKSYATRVCIGMCKKTGYCYLFTINRGYIIPALRIPSFKEAMILRKQLVEDEADIQRKCGIIQDLGWEHSEELMETIELQLKGVKEADKYPQKYKYLVSYIPEEPVFENIDNVASTNSSNGSYPLLKGFNQSYLMQFIQMGAVQMITNIPAAYKHNKTYSIKDLDCNIIEYVNKDNGLYAFQLGNDTNLISEYSLEELFE